MNIKRFLKPDWRKIVVFMILIIVFSPKSCGSSGWGGGASPSCKCYGILDTSPPWGMWDSYTYKCYGATDFNFVGKNPEFILIFMFEAKSILLILVSYLLSCLIIWVYDKFKVKRK